MVTYRLHVDRRTGKFAGERPTFYRYSMQLLLKASNLVVKFKLHDNIMTYVCFCHLQCQALDSLFFVDVVAIRRIESVVWLDGHVKLSTFTLLKSASVRNVRRLKQTVREQPTIQISWAVTGNAAAASLLACSTIQRPISCVTNIRTETLSASHIVALTVSHPTLLLFVSTNLKCLNAFYGRPM